MSKDLSLWYSADANRHNMTKKVPTAQPPVPLTIVERRIHIIRGHNVMLDSDLAELYEVETFNLNKAVKRNISRFPEDFMFQLTAEEWAALRFQIGISNTGRGGRRFMPDVFTEQGVAMLSTCSTANGQCKSISRS